VILKTQYQRTNSLRHKRPIRRQNIFRSFNCYGMKKTIDDSSSNKTFMTKTIRPLVLCFQNHFKSNSTLFLQKVDADGSIYSFGTKFCKEKKGQACTCSVI